MLPAKGIDEQNHGPSKTVETKDPNLSFSKAFEAVVAAGKRGLLGPAAMKAAVAIPEVKQNVGSIGVPHETPKPVPLMSATVNKVNETRSSLITIVPIAKGGRSLQPVPKEIWIFGNSVIVTARKRAQSQSYGLQLGIPTSRAHMYWRGVHGMKWEQLLPLLHETYHLRSPPSIIIIHAGEDDMLPRNNISFLTALKNDLSILKRALGPRDVTKTINSQAGAIIIWSSLLPKEWGKDLKPEDMEIARKHINAKIVSHCNEIGVHFLSHNLFTSDKTDLFLSSCSDLSDAGADIFIEDMRKVLRLYM